MKAKPVQEILILAAQDKQTLLDSFSGAGCPGWVGGGGNRAGCVKQLKIKWEFLHPFTVFWRIFLSASMDKSGEGG